MQSIPSEPTILEDLRRGKREAFQALYRLHYPMVRHLVVHNSGSTEEADDVFQDALLVLVDKLRNREFQLSASLKTYLYAVSRNLWLKRLRSKGKTKLIDFETPVELPEEDPEQEEGLVKDLNACLATLGDACRAVIERFYYLRQSMEEIAAQLGYTNADTAKTQKYKCVLRLRKLMEERKGNG